MSGEVYMYQYIYRGCRSIFISDYFDTDKAPCPVCEFKLGCESKVLADNKSESEK